MRPTRLLSMLLALAIVPVTFSAFATTFVVPPDRELVRRADAVYLATSLTSYTQLNDEGGIETVTPIRVEEVLKGERLAVTNLVEPGGEYEGRITLIPGVPRFPVSERMLLFLKKTGPDRFAVTELVLGKFAFHGARLVRDAAEINGWDPDLSVHQERERDAARFLTFVRDEIRGGMGRQDYFVTGRSMVTESVPSSPTIVPNIAPYTATSYTMLISGTRGGRWAVFPSGVTFFSGTTTEPGAPGGGATAINAAFTSWDNDCGSNVNYVYGGTDTGGHTQGLHAADGANTILFERDLSSWGVSPFTCSGNSYNGTLGIGGITTASGTNTVNGETFATTQEADVEMNRGIANCTLLFNNGDWNSAVTHEVGHTLGFRHADQTRDSGAACSTDASLECSTQAIMKSFISTGLNAALQVWDQHAVQAVYPGNICAPGGCTAPSITSQPQSTTIASGGSATLTVGAAGTAPLSYQWYTGTSGNTASPISGATGSSVTVRPTSTTSYWVRVTNSCGSANSNTATVTVTTSTCTPPSITSQPQSKTINGGSSTTLSVSASGTAPLSYQWYVGTSGNTASPISGATGSSVTVTPSGTTSYWVRVTNACGSANSSTATVTVTACTPPNILGHPGNGTITSGQSAALAVNPTGTNLNVQWYRGTAGNTSSPIAGGTSTTLVVSPTATTSYWASITNTCGTAYSVTATVTVVSTPPPATSAGVVKSDFNKDGQPDILWRYYNTGENYIWFMSGANQVGGQYLPTIAETAWHMEGSGDFNGDGNLDILWRHYPTGSNYVWFMNGTTQTGGAYLQAEPNTSWSIGGVADFDGNGYPDIVWRNQATGENKIWLMSGMNIIAVKALPPITDLTWKMQVVGDLNRDGSPDIIWREFVTGADYVWFMRGTVRVQANASTPGQYLPQISDTKWEINAIEDLDGNGSNDLIWRYYNTGEDYVWYMNGPTQIGGAYLRTINDVNWRIGGPR